jgi:hypothetical protein
VLAVLLFALGRLAGADPTIKLSRTLRSAGYERVSVVVLRGAGEDGRLVIDFDPQGQPAAAVDVLSRRAAETAWRTGEIRLASVSVRPRGGPPLELTAADLAGTGTPSGARQGYRQINSRARWVVVLAACAALLAFVLVLCASVAALSIARRRRVPVPPAD